MKEHEHDLYDLGLSADLSMLSQSPIGRRSILRLGAAGIGVLLAACGTQTTSSPPSGGAPPGSAASSEPTQVSANGACVEIPTETAGPYPADGSNASNQTLNALAFSGILRSDIRTSLTTKNVAAGVPTTVELTLVNVSSDCAPLAGYAIYLWHCDRDGNYSLYSNGVTDEDYLRGVQVADANGKVTFQTIFPACYSGRWPHIHFEIYSSAETATSSANVVHTSQLGIPEDVCNTVFANAEGYSNSVTNLSQITLASDNVFSDGVTSQMATVTGSIDTGYSVVLTVGVAA
jgi:protocatechuate 3,4-dioxygenase beta subunit